MEAKKNLNNVQRKMLDTIYTEQFDKRSKVIMAEREQGLRKLNDKLLKREMGNKDYKKMMEAGKLFYQMSEKLKDELNKKGMSISSTLHGEPKMELNGRSYYRDYELQEVSDYKDETTAIELKLAEKKKEMRAKIYGVAASYEEVDSDIKELLKDI